jgi:ATP-dependent Clp protease ATP-binding subunit ClpB
MNIEKFTDRAKGFLQSAQVVALRNNHQRITSEHLLKALLEDDQGLCAGLIKKAGGKPEQAVLAVDLALFFRLGQRCRARARFSRADW